MRWMSLTLIGLVLGVVGCKKPAPAPTTTDDSAHVVTTAPPPTPPVSDAGPSEFGLVAVGKKMFPAIVRTAKGHSMKIVGNDLFVARADGDGPLIVGPDMDVLNDLSPRGYLSVVAQGGSESERNIFALRSSGNLCTSKLTAFIHPSGGGVWTEAMAFRDREPKPFLSFSVWGEGALLVESPFCSVTPGSPPLLGSGPGVSFMYVAPDGTVSRPTLGVNPDFLPWQANSFGGVLGLIGTMGIRRDAGADSDAAGSGANRKDIVVMRIHANGVVQTSTLVHAEGFAMEWTRTQSTRASLQEFGSAALVIPPGVREDGEALNGLPANYRDVAWKGNASSIFLITDDDKTTKLPFRPPDRESAVADATIVGQAIYVIVWVGDKSELLRFGLDGSRENLRVPALAFNVSGFHVATAGEPSFPCTPFRFLTSPPTDIWMLASCGESEQWQVLFRRGHPQVAVVVP